MKITLTAKVVADISNDPNFDEPTLRWLSKLIEDGKVTYEMVWCTFDNNPTILIKETEPLKRD